VTTTTAPAARTSKGARAEFIGRHFGVLSISVVFAVLFLFFSIRADAFLTLENQVNIARQIAPTVVVAMGMTFVITTGAIDLSVGSIVGLTAAALALMAKAGNPFTALVLTICIGAAIGLINGALTAYGRLPSFIVTLAALTAVRGIALLITQGYSTPITSTFLLPTPRHGSRSSPWSSPGMSSPIPALAATSSPSGPTPSRCAAPVSTSAAYKWLPCSLPGSSPPSPAS